MAETQPEFTTSRSRITNFIKSALSKFPSINNNELPNLRRDEIHQRFPEDSYTQRGFDLNTEVNERTGLFVEIAGPTDNGYELTDLTKLPKKVHISNIYPGSPRFNPKSGKVDTIVGTVDFVADARKLPFKAGSIGILLASCLPGQINPDVLGEADRVLEPGGLFVCENTTDDLVESATLGDFNLVSYRKEKTIYSKDPRRQKAIISRVGNYKWNVVLQKKKDA